MGEYTPTDDMLALAADLHDYLTPHPGSEYQPEFGSTICLTCEVLARHVVESSWLAERDARVLREYAEDRLYDGDSDRPISDEYYAVLDRADRIERGDQS